MALTLLWRAHTTLGLQTSQGAQSPGAEVSEHPTLSHNSLPPPQEAPSTHSSASKEGAVKRVPSARLADLRTPEELARYDWMTQNVPKTQAEAVRLFFSRPAMLATAVAACGCAALRMRPSSPPLVAADFTVMLAVSLWWMLQEWVIHAKLLHSVTQWWGKDIHVAHHKLPYYHVSIDGFKVVAPTMLFGFTAFRLLFRDDNLFQTALASYYTMGLIYEWTHFLVHTRVPMHWWLGKVIKRAHVKHHLRDENFWFSFTCPPLDNLMGTTPSPWVVG